MVSHKIKQLTVHCVHVKICRILKLHLKYTLGVHEAKQPALSGINDQGYIVLLVLHHIKECSCFRCTIHKSGTILHTEC